MFSERQQRPCSSTCVYIAWTTCIDYMKIPLIWTDWFRSPQVNFIETDGQMPSKRLASRNYISVQRKTSGPVIVLQSIYIASRSRNKLCIRNAALQWRHNGCNGVSNHQPHDCLLKRLFRRRSKKTSKLRVTRLCAGNSPVTCEFPAQMASNAENVSIWWRHHWEVVNTEGSFWAVVLFHHGHSTQCFRYWSAICRHIAIPRARYPFRAEFMSS